MIINVVVFISHMPHKLYVKALGNIASEFKILDVRAEFFPIIKKGKVSLFWVLMFSSALSVLMSFRKYDWLILKNVVNHIKDKHCGQKRSPYSIGRTVQSMNQIELKPLITS